MQILREIPILSHNFSNGVGFGLICVMVNLWMPFLLGNRIHETHLHEE